MQSYRKKPVVVEAMQFTDTNSGMNIITWIKEWGVEVTGSQGVDLQGHLVPLLLIETQEGTMAAHIGWWVIKGVKGEIYPCRDDVFQETYEPVSAEIPQ